MIQEAGTDYTGSDIARLKMIAGMCRGSVLDIGCGNGKIREFLPIENKYVGIDPKPDYGVEQGNVYHSKFRQQFDTVLLLEVLEHLENPYLALDRIYTFLKPTGQLILSVPNPYNLDQIASLISINSNIINRNHLAMYGDNEIRSLCYHTGFSRVERFDFYTKIPVLNWLSPFKTRFGEWAIYRVIP